MWCSRSQKETCNATEIFHRLLPFTLSFNRCKRKDRFYIRSGEQDIYVKNLATGQIKQLTHNEDGRMSDRMDWLPDGKRIAYEHRAEAGDSIFVMNANGSKKKLFSPFRGEAPFMTAAPRWSPSGKYIMYPEMERTPDFKWEADTGVLEFTKADKPD